MHAVHPHLPRTVSVTLAAALATIVIMLALAARVGDVGAGQSPLPSPARTGVDHAAPPLVADLSAPAPGPSTWLRNPFTPLVPAPIEPPWTTANSGR